MNKEILLELTWYSVYLDQIILVTTSPYMIGNIAGNVDNILLDISLVELEKESKDE